MSGQAPAGDEARRQAPTSRETSRETSQAPTSRETSRETSQAPAGDEARRQAPTSPEARGRETGRQTNPETGSQAPTRTKARVMEAEDIRRAVTRIAHEICERNRGASDVVLVGVRTRGAVLAGRLADEIERIEGVRPPCGSLDVTLYRDDLATRGPIPVGSTDAADPSGKVVVLVDDVLYTGRTVRAALDALTDLGRPRSVQLAVLVDRGHRELPVRADFVGRNLPTAGREQVHVLLQESDDTEGVDIREPQ